MKSKPLYETSCKITKEEFERFARSTSNLRYMPVMVLIFEALAVWMLIRDKARGRSVIVDVALLILFPVIVYMIPRYMVSRLYAANKTAHNSVSVIRFYKNRFDSFTQSGRAEVPYHMLSRVIETPTNFYLQVSPQQTVIVVKANCSEPLIGFLRKLKADVENGKLKENAADGDEEE